MLRSCLPDYAWVDRQNTLEDFLAATVHAPWLTLDTEFLRTSTYYPILCLIQVSDGTRHALIDAQAGLDLSGLVARLRDPACISVLHACLQDVEILHHDFDLIPGNVFDTQVAWGLLGRGFQTSYSAMVKQQLGIALDKSQTRSRWDRRPLTPAQLEYAVLDVVHLAPIYQHLSDALERCGRLGWLHEEMAQALTPAAWIPDPDEAWRRIRVPERHLLASRSHILKALARWRELTARRLDRARPRIAADEILIDLTRALPRTRNDFNRLIGNAVPRKVQSELWAALEQTHDQMPPKLSTPTREERIAQQAKIRQLMAVARKVASELDMAPELLATRAMLAELVQRRPNPALLQGWRRDQIGLALQEALDAA